MTTTSPLPSGQSVAEAASNDVRARAAVKAFRGMVPGLTSFARILTGNKKIRVELSQGVPRTDGKKIYYCPPIALGDTLRHNKAVCDQRDDETGLQLCRACEVREYILIQIYHEISHIAFGSFDKTTDRDRKHLLELALKEYPSRFADQVKARVNDAPAELKETYLGMASIVSEFLAPLVNALEDCRIDNRMFDARRGTKKMFDAMTTRTFREGIETDQGMVSWHEQTLNAQVLVGVFCIGAEYDVTGWFHEDVVTALSDETLRSLVADAVASESMAQVYRKAFPVLARLRELGYCKTPFDDEQEEDESTDDSDGQDGPTGDDPDDDGVDGPTDSDGEGSPEDAQGDDQPEGQGGEDSQEVDQDGPGTDVARDEDAGDGVDDLHPDGDSDPAGDPEQGEQPESDEAGPESDQEAGAGEQGDVPESDRPDEASGGLDDPEGDDASGDESDDLPGSDGQGSDDSGADADGSEGGPEETQQGGQSPDQEDGDDQEAPEQGDGSGVGPSGSSDHGDDRQTGSAEQDAGPGMDRGGDDESDSSEAGEDRTDEGEVGHDQESDDGGHDPQDAADGGDSDGDAEGGQAGGSPSAPGAGSDLPLEQEGSEDDGGEAPDSEPSDADSGDDPSGEGEAEPVDTGADEGKGGAESDNPTMGTADDAIRSLEVLCHHGDIHDFDHASGDDSAGDSRMSEAEQKAMDVAVIQGLYFETPSVGVGDVRVLRFKDGINASDSQYSAWRYSEAYTSDQSDADRRMARMQGIVTDDSEDVSEAILGPAVLEARRTFDDNLRADRQKNMRSGKVRGSALGKRAWSGDDRLFGKKTVPGKKSYSVLIGIDISGSTMGENILLAKRAAWAQAELCQRVGIDFSIWAHTTAPYMHETEDGYSFVMDMYEVKGFDDEWTRDVQRSLLDLAPCSGNLDGHSLEFYRKQVERRNTTDKIILYYSDGKMPAANHDEELEVLEREIKYCDGRGITLLGVGIRTDSPRRHGLDTVQVDTDEDVGAVVSHLGKRLLLSR